MGWGATLNTDLFLNKINKEEIQNKYDENLETIKLLGHELYMLVSSNPRDICSEHAIKDGFIIEDIRSKLDALLTDYNFALQENVIYDIFIHKIDEVKND